MQILIGVLLLVSFLAMIVYSLRGGNLMLGILVMAVLWTVLPMVGNRLVTDPAFIEANKELIETPIMTAITKVFQNAPENWGKVLVTFIFGSWFGRVMLDTGIASTIIRKTVELGGDRAGLTAALLYIVTAAIFTSMFGAGAVVSIGIIVLPILLSLGVPKLLALVSFMLAVGAGFYINPVGFSQYQVYYLDSAGNNTVFYDSVYLRWGGIALAIQLVAAILVTLLPLHKQTAHAWAALSVNGEGEQKDAPLISLITPFLPVILSIVCKLPILVSFLLASFYAMLTCGKMKTYQETVKIFGRTFYDGVVDTAPLVGISAIIPMFNTASSYCVPYFQALLGDLVPSSTLPICLAFMVLAPFGLFRGPLTLAGAGSATLGILKSLGFSNTFLFPLMYAPTVTMNISCCITQSWIVWGISYTKVSGRDFLKKSIPTGWIICILLTIITYVMFGR